MRIPILSIMFVMVLFVSLSVSIIAHEELHKIIFEEYGINSTITYFTGWSPDAKTTPVNDSPSCNDACQTSHNINEAISYNLSPFFFMMGFGLFIIIIILEMRD